jgi:hypothetical protein
MNHKYGNMGPMKTTIEIADPLFRRAKARAAERGQSLRQFVAEALHEKLVARTGQAVADEPAWMLGFGSLRRLHAETRRVQATIDEAFGAIEPEDLA